LSTPDLSVEQLDKRFADHVAVDRLSFAVERGSFFSILGPSGCGKTTLLRMIAGFTVPDSGDIRIGGRQHARRWRPTADRSTWCSSTWRCFR
jgi:spermidine/putrescine transport system ATP-binding protein